MISCNEKTFLKILAKTILKNIDNANEGFFDQAMMAINYYIWRNFSHSASASGQDPYEIFINLDAQCQGRTIFFAYLADHLGLNNRIISIHNYPVNTSGSHSVIEIYYNNGFHLFDPLNGGYYENNGNILSLENLMINLKNKNFQQLLPALDNQLISEEVIKQWMPNIYDPKTSIYCSNSQGKIFHGLANIEYMSKFSGNISYDYTVIRGNLVKYFPVKTLNFEKPSKKKNTLNIRPICIENAILYKKQNWIIKNHGGIIKLISKNKLYCSLAPCNKEESLTQECINAIFPLSLRKGKLALKMHILSEKNGDFSVTARNEAGTTDVVRKEIKLLANAKNKLELFYPFSDLPTKLTVIFYNNENKFVDFQITKLQIRIIKETQNL